MQPSNLTPIVNAVKRQRVAYFVMFAFFILGGVFFLWLFYLGVVQSTTTALETRLVFAGFAFVTLVPALWTFYKGMQLVDVTRAPIMQLFMNRTQDIVWVYHQIFTTYNNGIRQTHASIEIGTSDGKFHKFGINHARLDETLKFIQSVAPRAAFGYSEEVRKKFKTDPRSLLKS